MKKFNPAIIVLLLLLYSCSGDSIKVSSNSLNKEGYRYKYQGELFNGTVVDTTATGRVLLTFNCIDGKIDGDFLEYHENGTLSFKCNYVKGLKEGPATHYFDTGNKQIFETYYKGKKTGPYKEYYSIGKLMLEGFYKNWKKDSLWIEYTESEKKRAKGYYQNGLQFGLWEYYFENGKIELTGIYENGNGRNKGATGIPKNGRIGIWKYHNKERFFLETDIEYRDGVATGAYKTYFSNGNIETQGQLKDGNYDGWFKFYDEKGNELYKKKYINGNEIK